MKKKSEQKQLLVFAYGLPLILGFIAVRQYFKHGMNALVVTLPIIAVFVLILALLKHPWLKIIFKYWMKGVGMIGTVVTTCLLGIIYFCVFTPVAIYLRFAKKDYMRQAIYKKAETYWIDRSLSKDEHGLATEQF
jgi:hypothetical protein